MNNRGDHGWEGSAGILGMSRRAGEQRVRQDGWGGLRERMVGKHAKRVHSMLHQPTFRQPVPLSSVAPCAAALHLGAAGTARSSGRGAGRCQQPAAVQLSPGAVRAAQAPQVRA